MADNLSTEHFTGFGAVTHYYALVETGLKLILSDTLNIDIGVAIIISEPYGALDTRNVLKSLNKLYARGGKLNEELSQIIGDLSTFGPLRNSIAHSQWCNGERPRSIKPMRLDIRSGKPVTSGSDPEEKDYTAEDLLEEASKLELLHERICKFLEDSGAKERIDENISRRRSYVVPVGGISKKKSKP